MNTSLSLRRFLKSIPMERRKPVIITTCALALIAVSASVYAAMSETEPVAPASSSEINDEANAALNVTNPVRISGSSSTLILGKVISHEIANIYPRRDGIVEDIYIDIGDHVGKGQVVALMLPKGVEGQSAAMIAEKQAQKQRAASDLRSAELVADETVIGARQSIKEKETQLEIALREQKQMLERFAEAEADIAQKREQAFTAIRQIRQTVEMIMLASNSRQRDDITVDEMIGTLGQLNGNDIPRAKLVTRFNDLLRLENEYLNDSDMQRADRIDALMVAADALLNQASALLQSTPAVPTDAGYSTFTHRELSDALASVTRSQDSVLKAKEQLEDARTAFRTMTAAEPELFAAYNNSRMKNMTSNKVQMLETQIQSAYNALELTQANQSELIESRKSQLNIADAMLRSEYSQSGHRQIRSPFSGIVSKRFIEVGQIVMPSMPAFELTGVPTSLAKKAKAEIRFGLPEKLIESVNVGDTVTFILQTNETEEFTAEVTRKSPQVDLETHTITIQAKIPDELDLPHQTSVRVRITDEHSPLFRVPSIAVKRENDRNVLWIVDPENDEPVRIEVSVTSEDGEFAEITGELSEQTNVILDPPDLFLTQDND